MHGSAFFIIITSFLDGLKLEDEQPLSIEREKDGGSDFVKTFFWIKELLLLLFFFFFCYYFTSKFPVLKGFIMLYFIILFFIILFI